MLRTTLLASLLMVGAILAGEPASKQDALPTGDLVILQSALDADDEPPISDIVRFSEPTIVRITGSVRAGGSVSAKILGAGKLLRKASIRRMSQGHFAIGASEQEFDVQLSPGTTTVVVTSRVPEDKALTRVSTYTFRVGMEQDDGE